ncbi:MAG TPA: hypothetical protein VEQ10_17740, partial [Vicinamibacteria bacterium]|nr:hypothetical protein [Vicinamibacteria bacterium]
MIVPRPVAVATGAVSLVALCLLGTAGAASRPSGYWLGLLPLPAVLVVAGVVLFAVPWRREVAASWTG